LLRGLDPATIGAILDPANLMIEGSMDLRMALDMIGPFVDLVHVKNIRWERTAAGQWRWRFDELAEGMCDWAVVVPDLQRVGYDGWLSFENLGGCRSGTGATSPRTSPTRRCRPATSISASPTSWRICVG
jgi:sugar phosphate isomerase/epimerase